MKKKMVSLLLAGTMVMSLMGGITAGATAADDQKIVISTQAGDGAQEAWEAVAAAYEALNPGVDVVVDLKSEEGYDQWLANVFANNTTTEVDLVNINLAGGSSKDKSIKWSDYLDNESPYSDGLWRDQFSVDNQTVDPADGSFDALSLFTVQVLWMYNQEIFAEAGVESIPTTWDELIAACEKIQAAGYQPIAMDGDYNSFYAMTMGWLSQIYTDQTTRSMIEVTRAQEGDFCYDPDLDAYFEYDPTDPWNDDYVTNNKVRFWGAVADGTYTPDTVGMKTVWENFAKVFPAYAGGEAMWGTNNEGANTLFYQGKAAMMVNGGWGIIDYANNMKELAESGILTDKDGNEIEGAKTFTLGTFPMPSMEGEGIEAKARTIEVANGFLGAVSKSQEHDELVLDFVMYYSSLEGMSVYLDALLGNGGVVNGPCLVYGVEYPEYINSAFENVEYIGNCQKGFGAALSRGLSDLPESTREYYNNAYNYLTGAITVDEYLDAQVENYATYLDAAMEAAEVSMNDIENPAAEPTGE